jgi:hypothetical protein
MLRPTPPEATPKAVFALPKAADRKQIMGKNNNSMAIIKGAGFTEVYKKFSEITHIRCLI